MRARGQLPACGIWRKSFPSNHNGGIDGGGISRSCGGQPAGPSEGHLIQVCIQQARLLVHLLSVPGRLHLLYWPLGLLREWNYVGGIEQIGGVVESGAGSSARAASRPRPTPRVPAPARRPAAGSRAGDTRTQAEESCSPARPRRREAPSDSHPPGGPCR